MLKQRNFLVNRVQKCQGYTEKRTFIPARFIRIHPLVGIFYPLVGIIYWDIQVQVAEKQ
jgi:hypothetical protein